MITTNLPGNRNVWMNPRIRDKRKGWINAFRKRVALIDLASGGPKDEIKNGANQRS